MATVESYDNTVGAYRRVWEFVYTADFPIYQPDPRHSEDTIVTGKERKPVVYHVIAANEKLARAAWDQHNYTNSGFKLVSGPTQLLVIDAEISCS